MSNDVASPHLGERSSNARTSSVGGPLGVVYAAPITGGDFEPVEITLFKMRDGTVAEITNFTMPALSGLFGLPDRLLDA